MSVIEILKEQYKMQYEGNSSTLFYGGQHTTVWLKIETC